MLLSKTKSIKITDFGLSRKLYHELGETFDPEVPLPWRWMAPESLRCLTFSSETDAWSYGVTLWEIFSLGDIPFALSGFSNQFIVELENGLRLEKPVYASEEM
jgi:serine/threonine protein kinase